MLQNKHLELSSSCYVILKLRRNCIWENYVTWVYFLSIHIPAIV